MEAATMTELLQVEEMMLDFDPLPPPGQSIWRDGELTHESPCSSGPPKDSLLLLPKRELIFSSLLASKSQLSLACSLSCPAARETTVVFATEEMVDSDQNQIVILGNAETSGAADAQMVSVPGPVTALVFADNYRLLFGLGGTGGACGLLQWHRGSELPVEPVIFPAWHTDDIRDMCVTNDAKLITASYDGRVALVDLNLVGDANPCIQHAPLGTSVSSVAMHPFLGESVVSVTTDTGALLILDMREHQSSHSRQRFVSHNVAPAGEIFSSHRGLFDHCWLDGTSVACGYGSGLLAIVDCRKGATVERIRDSKNQELQNIVFDAQTATLAACGRYTRLWKVNDGELSPSGVYEPKYDRAKNNAGVFCNNQLAITASDSSMVFLTP